MRTIAGAGCRVDDLLARIAKKEVEEVFGGWLEAARPRRMRLLLYASGVERPARGVPVMVRAGPRVPAMGLQQRPKLDTQTYEMEKVDLFYWLIRLSCGR